MLFRTLPARDFLRALRKARVNNSSAKMKLFRRINTAY